MTSPFERLRKLGTTDPDDQGRPMNSASAPGTSTTLPYPTRGTWWATDDQLFAQTDTAILSLRPDGTVTEVIQLQFGLAGPFTLAPR